MASQPMGVRAVGSVELRTSLEGIATVVRSSRSSS